MQQHHSKQRRVSALVFALLATSPSAFAQQGLGVTDQPHDEIIVVTGSRLNPTSLDLREIDAEDILSSAPLSAAFFLRNVAGVSVIQPGGAGRAEIALRGAESNFTVVLLDGIRVNDPTNSRGGSFDFTTIAPTEIDRVDILMGGFSGQYGSDALSGVVNIITKGPGDEEASNVTGSTMIGDRGYRSFGGTVRLPGRLSLSAAHHNSGSPSKGFSQKLSTVQVKGVNEVNGWALAATARGAQSDSTGYPDASGGSLFAASDALETIAMDSVLLGGSATRQFTGDDAIVVTTGLSHRKDSIDTPAISGGTVQGRPSSTAETRYDRAQITAYGRKQISGRISGVLGVDVIEETGRTISNTDFGFFSLPGDYKLRRTTLAGFGEARLSLWDKVSDVRRVALYEWLYSSSRWRLDGPLISVEKGHP